MATAFRDRFSVSLSGEAGPFRHFGSGLAFRMQDEGPRSCILDPDSAPLASLAGGALARRFQSWRGASGRRYVFTVHSGADSTWPDYENAVLVLAARSETGAMRMLFVGLSGEASREALAFAARNAPASNIELHVHLLAETPCARRAVLADLAGLACAS